MASIAELLERDCVVHIDATIPAEMTIAEWRRVRTRLRAMTRGARVRTRLRAMTRGARRRRVLESFR
jgi:hypothetical protein